MSAKLVVVLAWGVVLAAAVPAEPTGAPAAATCALDGRNLRDGEEATSPSRGHYRCEGGALRPAGCKDPGGNLVPVGLAFIVDSFQFRCEASSDGKRVDARPEACVLNGLKIARDSSERVDRFWYTCSSAEGGGLRLRIAGCVDEDGTLVTHDQTFKTGDFQYRCLIANGTATVVTSGCVFKGRTVEIGAEIADENYWSVCQSRDGIIFLQVGGCIHEGRKLVDGQRFYSSDFVQECQVLANGARRAVIGCLEKRPDGARLEHPPNGTWVEGQAPIRFVAECQNLSDGSWRKMITACRYEGAEGDATIEPGCAKPVGNLFIECTNTGFAFSVRTWARNEENLRFIQQKGSRLC